MAVGRGGNDGSGEREPGASCARATSTLQWIWCARGARSSSGRQQRGCRGRARQLSLGGCSSGVCDVGDGHGGGAARAFDSSRVSQAASGHGVVQLGMGDLGDGHGARNSRVGACAQWRRLAVRPQTAR
ncbi:hypothetical protein VPH35_014287 [Triticum aestivum]